MASGDLTIREVFQQLIESQNKGVAVQKDTACALVSLSKSVDEFEERLVCVENKMPFLGKYQRLIVAVSIGGWIIAALALGVKGLLSILSFLGL